MDDICSKLILLVYSQPALLILIERINSPANPKQQAWMSSLLTTIACT